MLPCNIMACNKMLILCGSSYPSRLWCVWEMCTLFALSQSFKDHLQLEAVKMREPMLVLVPGIPQVPANAVAPISIMSNEEA